jgi:conjugative transfer signal peptidase TraF
MDHANHREARFGRRIGDRRPAFVPALPVAASRFGRSLRLRLRAGLSRLRHPLRGLGHAVSIPIATPARPGRLLSSGRRHPFFRVNAPEAHPLASLGVADEPSSVMANAASSRTWILIGALAIVCLGVAERRSGDVVLYNHSPSIPRGFYLRVDRPIERAAIVTVRAADVAPEEARRRKFDGPRDRFIKRVAGVSGDVVCASGDHIDINGRRVAERAQRDSEGRTLPRWKGCRMLAAQDVFLLGDAANSFDGRYFGVVGSVRIEGVWRPLRFRCGVIRLMRAPCIRGPQ